MASSLADDMSRVLHNWDTGGTIKTKQCVYFVRNHQLTEWKHLLQLSIILSTSDTHTNKNDRLIYCIDAVVYICSLNEEGFFPQVDDGVV